jgi:hypothetical protein
LRRPRRLKAARDATAELLDRLTDAEWKREGTTCQHGRYGMDTWLNIYSAHAHDHADQIRRACPLEKLTRKL